MTLDNFTLIDSAIIERRGDGAIHAMAADGRDYEVMVDMSAYGEIFNPATRIALHDLELGFELEALGLGA